MECHRTFLIFGAIFFFSFWVLTSGIFSLMMIGVCIVYLIFFLIEDLKLHKVEALLYEIHIPEMLQMQDEFSNRSKRHFF